MDHCIGKVFPHVCYLVLPFDDIDLLPDAKQQYSQCNGCAEEKVKQLADRTCPRIEDMCLYSLCVTDRISKSPLFVEQAFVIGEIPDVFP